MFRYLKLSCDTYKKDFQKALFQDLKTRSSYCSCVPEGDGGKLPTVEVNEDEKKLYCSPKFQSGLKCLKNNFEKELAVVLDSMGSSMEGLDEPTAASEKGDGAYKESNVHSEGPSPKSLERKNNDSVAHDKVVIKKQRPPRKDGQKAETNKLQSQFVMSLSKDGVNEELAKETGQKRLARNGDTDIEKKRNRPGQMARRRCLGQFICALSSVFLENMSLFMGRTPITFSSWEREKKNPEICPAPSPTTRPLIPAGRRQERNHTFPRFKVGASFLISSPAAPGLSISICTGRRWRAVPEQKVSKQSLDSTTVVAVHVINA